MALHECTTLSEIVNYVCKNLENGTSIDFIHGKREHKISPKFLDKIIELNKLGFWTFDSKIMDIANPDFTIGRSFISGWIRRDHALKFACLMSITNNYIVTIHENDERHSAIFIGGSIKPMDDNVSYDLTIVNGVITAIVKNYPNDLVVASSYFDTDKLGDFLQTEYVEISIFESTWHCHTDILEDSVQTLRYLMK
jgi:hypothetical protein